MDSLVHLEVCTFALPDVLYLLEGYLREGSNLLCSESPSVGRRSCAYSAVKPDLVAQRVTDHELPGLRHELLLLSKYFLLSLTDDAELYADRSQAHIAVLSP